MPDYEFYPALAVAANKAKDLRAGLKYWFAIMSYGVGGKHVPSKTTREMLIETFGMHPRHSYRTLATFDGILWDVIKGLHRSSPGELRIYTPEEVAKAYGLKSPGYHEERPLSELTQGDVSAYVFKALLETKVEAASPLTRASLQELTGIKIRSQQCYHSRMKIKSNPNFVVEGAFDSVGSARQVFLDKDLLVGPYKIATVHIKHPQRTAMVMNAVLKQIGNTYQETYVPAKDSNLVYLGVATGQGIWIEKKLCCNLHPHITGTLILTGAAEEGDIPYDSSKRHPLDLASNYYIAREAKAAAKSKELERPKPK